MFFEGRLTNAVHVLGIYIKKVDECRTFLQYNLLSKYIPDGFLVYLEGTPKDVKDIFGIPRG